MSVTEVPAMSEVGAVEERTVVVKVPAEVVAGVAALLQLYAFELPALDKVLGDELSKAKALGALIAVRELKSLRELGSRMYAPLHRAALRLAPSGGAEVSGKGPGQMSVDEVGAFTPRTHTLFGHTWKDGPLDLIPMPAAGVLLPLAEEAAAGLVARVGIRGAAAAVADTAVASNVARRSFGELMKKLVTRGVLPALGIASLTAAFQSCGRLIGIGIGAGVILKAAGSATGRKLLGDAMPWILTGVGVLYILKRKGR
jgi:hypothetical protein